MTNPPTPQMPKPDRTWNDPDCVNIRHLTRAWFVNGGTTTIEQFAQEKADRVEELEKFLVELRDTAHPYWIRNAINKILTNPGEKGAEG